MMIHEKLMSGQFLLDLKNDRSRLLNTHHHNQHNLSELHPQHQSPSAMTTHYLNHHHHRHQSLHFPLKPQSPPMPAMNIDLYAAYAYQQQQQQQQQKQQQQQLTNNNIVLQQHNFNKAGALDLSRRCDSVETPRKTPSPGQTNSSVGTASPAASPKNTMDQLLPQQPIIPTNLLYSMQAQQHNIPKSNENLNGVLPNSLASLYPALYYSSGVIKPEPLSASSPSPISPPLQASPPAITTVNSSHSITSPSDLLQTFATAAAATTNDTSALKSTISPKSSASMCMSPKTNDTMTMSTSSTNLGSLASHDTKTTRPFKAFPRDPLVIAANFAATDVLLDNPRVERYTEYRKRVLEQIRNSNGGTRTVTNPKMRRTNNRNSDFNSSACRSSSEERHDDDNKSSNSKINVTSVDESSDCESNTGSFADQVMTSSTDSQTGKMSSNGVIKDAAYYERRRKNNAAAKKSRDRRRIKEDEIAIRAAYLERQNIELLCQIDALKAQIAAFTSKVRA